VIHDQDIATGELRLSAELGIKDWLAAGLIFPVRTYRTSIRYFDPAGDEVMIENPFLHHRNETLTGPGDPWVYGRAAVTRGGFLLGARLGVSVPLGRTEEDPFAAGDAGLAHEHSQFGSGTLMPIVGVDASRSIGPVRLDATALTIQSLYANGKGFQTGDRYAVVLGASSGLGTKNWRFRATVETIHETAERWGGIIQMDEGNIGRTDVLTGLEATYRISPSWQIGASIKLPAYTHVVGGQLDALGYAGINIGTQFHLFEEDDHDHEHGDHHDHAPADWSGLDKADASTDGSAVPLTPVPGKITVFDFWATWCEPCEVLDNELAELARKHPDDIAVRKINVIDTDSPAYKKYLGDLTIPHVKIFGRDGNLIVQKSDRPVELARLVEQAISGKTAKPAPRLVDPMARRIDIEVLDDGYHPATIEIEHGTPVTLVFTRKSEATCAVDVHFELPDGTRIDEMLPLGKAVAIPIKIEQPGTLRYRCGMDMNHGTIVIK
jgi:thiol-disulfide isomerase/thioredoxin